jgi:hypothetical protein
MTVQLFLSMAHHRMMDASEEAIWRASSEGVEPERRIAADVVSDDSIFRIWQPGHLELLEAAAIARRERERRLQLRRIATVVEHRRVIFDHVRAVGLKGDDRKQFFNTMFRHTDYQTAVLREHRRYVLAVSSSISMRRLMCLHNDFSGARLLDRYREANRHYFDLYYQWLNQPKGVMADVLHEAMMSARFEAQSIRQRMLDTSEDDTQRLATMKVIRPPSIRWTEMGTTILR